MTTVPFFTLIVKIQSQQKCKLTEALKQVISHPFEEYYIIIKKKSYI